MFTFAPLTEAYAREMLRWRYAPPYDIYSFSAPDESAEIAYLLDPAHQFHAICDADGVMLGFCSFGDDARVAGGDYTEPALDVGAGMRPDLTGQGHGADYLAAVFAFAEARFRPKRLRATIAAFNTRAQRAVAACGFERRATFTSTTASPKPFHVYTRAVTPSTQ